MGVETIGSGMDINPHLVDALMDDEDDDTSSKSTFSLDARRRLEDKIEELRSENVQLKKGIKYTRMTELQV